MKIAAVIQARMNSARFPGKMLHEVHGRPLLQHVVDRARRSREIDGVIVATSLERSDDEIAGYCDRAGIECVRGSLDDVASRFLAVSDACGLDGFARVCGDSPLLDATLLDLGVRAFRERDVDFVTNCLPRTFPGGQSVEVVRVEAFRRVYPRMTSPAHFEHVTAFLYEYAAEFRIHTLTNPAGNQSQIDLSVNTPAQMALFERLVGSGDDVPDLSAAIARYRAVAV